MPKDYFKTQDKKRKTDVPYLHYRRVDNEGKISQIVFYAGFNNEVSFVDTYPSVSYLELKKIVTKLWKEQGAELVNQANSNEHECDKWVVVLIPRKEKIMNQILKARFAYLDISSIELFLETWANSYSLSANLKLFGFDENREHKTDPEFNSATDTQLMIAKHNLIAYMVLLRLKLMLDRGENTEAGVIIETERNLKNIYNQLPDFAKF